MTITPLIRVSLLGVLSLASLSALRAQAVITWGAAQHVIADTDVSTTGTSVWALNFGGGGASSFTLNTVVFTGAGNNAIPSSALTLTSSSGNLNGFNSTFGSGAAPYVNLSANYKTLLNSAVYWEVGTGATKTLTLQNLTVGNTYQLQIWNNDSRLNSPGRSSIFNDNLGNSVELLATQEMVAGGVGSFVTGTFIATSTAEVLHGLEGVGTVVQMNAMQLRDITGVSAVPEPSTYAALAGACALGLAVWQRRRAAQKSA